MPLLTPLPSPHLPPRLNEALMWPPEYGDGLSSHLPMALAALDRLGADDARLLGFAAGYSARFTSPWQPARTEPLSDWSTSRGLIDAFERLRQTFAAMLNRQGRDAVLRALLPSLITGVGAVAFHGLIRTAHAVESDHDAELAAALAYWAARWMPLPAASGSSSMTDVGQWLQAIDAGLAKDDAQWHSNAPRIAGRMQQASATTTYARLGAGPGMRNSTVIDGLGQLGHAAAQRYAVTRNFTVLHLATAARAARILAAWMPPDPESWKPLWPAVAAASIASGAGRAVPAVAAQMAAPAGADCSADADWPEVLSRARCSADDHVIKLVHAMAWQHDRRPDAVWQAAARMALRQPAVS